MAAPDLSQVQIPAEFMTALRDYRALRGKPGYRDMAIRCGQAKTASTLREALVADDLPKLATLRAILTALQSGPADEAAFMRAWERLEAGKVVVAS